MIGTPRVHGNGFIQLNLTSTTRLNIWGHPEIPKQVVSTQIHDHMFGFESRILLGVIGNRRYLRCCGNMYLPHQAAPSKDGEDTDLEPLVRECDLERAETVFYGPGDTYLMSPGEIHETVTLGPAATIITKVGERRPGPATVYVKKGEHPDNEFRRQQHEDGLLWRIISDVMLGAHIVRLPVDQMHYLRLLKER